MKIQELVHDVMEYDSGVVGPKVAIIGGTHGNELTGIEVVRQLRADLKGDGVTLVQGKLLLVLGNPRAIDICERGSTEKANLNACFSAAVLHGDDLSYEAVRARELAPVFAGVDLGIDIHATNKPGKPFLVCQRTPTRADLAVCRRFRVKTVITDPNWVFAGGPETLDEYLASQDGVGICYETGYARHTSRVDIVRREILDILSDYGLINRYPSRKSRIVQETYALGTAITLTEKGFCYAAGMGRYNLQKVAAGTVVGSHGTESFQALEDSIIVFPRLKKMWSVGKPVGYLARRVYGT